MRSRLRPFRIGLEPPLEVAMSHDRPVPLPASGIDRRRALGTLAAAAAGVALSARGAALPKVAVIGGGMAGVACAWLLDGTHDVTLFEARASIGGNVRTVPITVGADTWFVDMGAQFFHPGPYPAYVELLGQLGLYPPGAGPSHSFTASITLDVAGDATPRFVSPVLPGRAWPLAAPFNRAGIEAFNVAFDAAQRREQLDAPWSLTLGEWLPTLGLSSEQWEGMILPWAASLYSGGVEQARGLSARSAMVFAARALPDNPLDPLLYFVLDNGLIDALERMAAQFTTVAVHTAAPVSAVIRQPGGGFVVTPAGGPPVIVDDVVFAASGEPTLALLAGVSGSARQRAALQGIEFHDARLMLHADPVYAASSPVLRSFFNARIEGGFCEASMSLAEVLPASAGSSAPPAWWKSWVTHRNALPQQVLHDVTYRHLLPTPASLSAQKRLQARQGDGHVWFAGGYLHPFDAQETALISAIDVAAGLGAASSSRWRALSAARALKTPTSTRRRSP
jgi:predicted NAD/FAD-binding protein